MGGNGISAALLFLFIGTNANANDDLRFMDNGVVKLGVDMTRGGSIAWFGASNSTQNLVNAHDMEREIQLSLYSGPSFYNPDDKCEKLFMDQEWCWNPIGAGDIKGNHGEILDFTINDDATAHILSTPL